MAGILESLNYIQEELDKEKTTIGYMQELIDYYDQLELMGKERARGYFRQTEDISFPEYAEHKPINTVNRLKGKYGNTSSKNRANI